MKIIYDKDGRLSEILGSGENGSFKEGEMEFFTNYFNSLINTEKEVKIKALEEQKIKEMEFYKRNAEIAKANSESNASIAKANSEASIASSNALVAFFTTVSVVALTTLALKKPELFENNAQSQNPETTTNPSLPESEYKNEDTNQSSKPFDPDERIKPVK